MLSQLLYLYKQAYSGLANRQGFVTTVVSTMSITLGALLCVLTLAYVLIIKPLPYPNQDNLMVVKHHLIDANNQQDGNAFTYPNLMHLYHQQKVFEQSALAFYSDDVIISQQQQRFATAYVTPSWFTLFNATASIGRLFEQSEALNTHQPVALISHQMWQQEFSSDPGILDQSLKFNDISYRIVGVLSADFIEPQLSETGRNSDVFLPWDYNSVGERDRKAWGNDDSRLYYIAQHTSHLTKKQISQQLTTLVNSNWQEKVAAHQFFTNWSIKLTALSLKSQIIADSGQSVYFLLAGVCGLLLIACTNIANLFLSRMVQQQQTLAIHAAMGATPKNLFRLVLCETTLLMSLSMALAILFSMAGFSIMQHHLGGYLPRLPELHLSGFTLLCALTLCVLLSLTFAALNARSINYQVLNSNLQSSGKGTGIQVSKRVRQLLIASQICIVTVLVFVNISLFKDSLAIINKDDGFNINQLTSVRLSQLASERPSFEKRVAMMNEIRQELLAMPQIEAVSQSSAPLANFGIYAMSIADTKLRFTPQAKGIDHQFFPMIKQPLIAGNNFTASDLKDQNNVLVINRTMAHKLLGDANASFEQALGINLNFGGEENHTVIGIVENASVPGNERTTGRIYHPTSLASTRLLLKLKPSSTFDAPQFSKLLKGITSQYALYDITPQEQRRSDILFTQYTTAVTSVVLAVITLLLTTIGLYGILSYSTQLRRREIGTRQAIGAKRLDIIKLIVVDNLKPIVIGVTISVLLLLALASTLGTSISKYISVEQLPLFSLTLLLISAIAAFACYWPLRQFINRPVMYSLRAND